MGAGIGGVGSLVSRRLRTGRESRVSAMKPIPMTIACYSLVAMASLAPAQETFVLNASAGHCIKHAAFSPKGIVALGQTNGEVQLYSTTQKKVVRSFAKQAGGRISALAFSPSGDR